IVREVHVLTDVEPGNEEAERDHRGHDADEETPERIGGCFCQDAEIKEALEEQLRQRPPQRVACSDGHVAEIVARMALATGSKSGWSVARKNVSSSDGPLGKANSVMECSATNRPDDRITTREHSFSTMSKRCVLNKIMRPSLARSLSSARKRS